MASFRTSGQPSPERLLGIYLNDHLAGATGSLELAKRVRDENDGTELGEVMDEIFEELAADRRTLIEVIDRLGLRRDPVKPAAAWIAEKAARLKPNGQLTGYSPLSRLIELEGLFLGITAKIELWRLLAAMDSERLDGIEFGRLIDRAEVQRTRLETFRLVTAGEALVPA